MKVAGEFVTAPRVALMVSGIDLKDLWALHRCNNPICVNPGHLYAGTPAQNFDDMVAAGTVFRPDTAGSKNGNARLNEVAVIDIRERRLAGERVNDLAREYGVSRKIIGGIMSGRRWKHVGSAHA